ncbi:hypothetical protein ACRRTK_017530 [Alexandromys fortis]
MFSRAQPGVSPQRDDIKIEDIITKMQDDKTGGVPIRTVKSFLSKIPSVVTAWFSRESLGLQAACVTLADHQPLRASSGLLLSKVLLRLTFLDSTEERTGHLPERKDNV